MLEKIRLLVVDDHPVVRAGLRTLLDRESDMEVVGEAEDAGSAVAAVSDLKPDIVVMDITLADSDGLVATGEIKARWPETKVIVLTIHDDEGYLRQALAVGATGYVLKQAADTELVVAVRAVSRGEVFLYPTVTRVLLGDIVPPKTGDGTQRPGFSALSPREESVLRYVALGYTNREVAEKLSISVKTVETYRARVMEKLDLKSRSALVRYALSHGLMDA